MGMMDDGWGMRDGDGGGMRMEMGNKDEDEVGP